MNMVHLHVHSQYSMQDGLCSLDDLVKQAAKFKMKAVALTDHDGLYGAVQFYKKAKNAGIKPIIGCEIRVKDNQKSNQVYHFILLVKDKEGYSNLCQIITRAHLSDSAGSIPAIEKEILARYSKGIIGLSGCDKGEIPSLLLQKKIEQAEKVACWYQQVFGKENFYLELSFHGTSYALISFVTCYLKVHYPACYLASMLTYGMGYYSHDRYIQEARRFNVKVLLPDINKSGAGFTVEDGAIRVGLGKIKGMGEKHLKSILSLREKCKRFNSLYDFCCKTISLRINQPLIENLIKVGAFDFTAYPRSALLTLLPLTLKEVRKKKAKDGAQNKISELISSDSIPAYRFSKSFQMNLEKEILDLYVSDHPLSRYNKELTCFSIIKSNQIENIGHQKPIFMVGILIQARRQFTRQKQVMAFLLLEDEVGFFEVITFPAVYQKYSNLFRKEAPLLIEGVLSKNSGDFKIIAQKIVNINSYLVSRESYLVKKIGVRSQNINSG